jgi:hypothetical protein
MGTGESGLLFDDLTYYYQLSWSWSEQSLGEAAPMFVITRPFYFCLSLLERIGVPAVILQASVFWLILVASGLSVYSLTLTIKDRDHGYMAATLAGLFYMLNPYAMTAIWNRFQLTFMFSYALLPLVLFLYIKGLKLHNIKYTIYLNLAALAFVYGFAAPAFIGTFWLLLFSYFIFSILTRRKTSEVIYTMKFTLLTFFIWLVLNLWWIPQLIITGPYRFEPESDPHTLLYFSRYTTLPNVFRLISPEWQTWTWQIGLGIYSSASFLLLSFLSPIFTFLFLLFGSKNRTIFFFAFLSILGLFFVKGAAPPFGEVFLWAFTYFPSIQLFRNTWEKLGTILVLGYAPLFGVSLSSLYRFLGKRLRISFLYADGSHLNLEKVFAIAFVALFCTSSLGGFLWPMWTGRVFSSGVPPQDDPDVGYYVNVPQYYREANTWLSNQPEAFRVIVLPIDGEGITYNWTYGYTGIELSNQLLGRSSISIATGVTYTARVANDIITRLEGVLSRTSEFWKVMALLNAKYIMVRWDIDYKARSMSSPEDITQILNYTLRPNVLNGEVNMSSPNVRLLTGEYLSVIWANYTAGPVILTNNTVDTRQSINTITISGYSLITTGGSNLAFYYHLPKDQQNWSDVLYLEVWFKSNVPGIISVGISDAKGGSIEWDGHIDKIYSVRNEEVNLWKLFVFPLSTPSKKYREIDLNNVEKIGFVLDTGGQSVPAEFKISGVFADSGKVERIAHIDYVKSFDKLHFYQINPKYFLPKIYGTNQFIFSRDIDTMLFSVIQNESFIPGENIIFLLSQSNINNITLLEKFKTNYIYKPSITFERVNPTKYIAHVKNATNQFFLVFSEAYHPLWKLYINNEEVSDEYHFIVNGYANAWYINKTGSFDVILEFWPQKIVHIGSVISSITFTFCLIYSSKDRIKTLYQKYLRNRNTIGQSLLNEQTYLFISKTTETLRIWT